MLSLFLEYFRIVRDMQTYCRFVLSIAFFLSACVLHGQNIGITTRIEPAEIQIGEQALVRLKIRTDDIDNTYLIIPPDSTIHRAEAISFRVIDTVHLEGTLKELSAEMVLTSFDSTLIALPAFGVRVGEQEIYSTPLYLKVNLPEVDMEHPEEFFGLKKEWSRSYTLWDIFILLRFWILAIAILGLLVTSFFLYRYYIQRRNIQKKKEPLPAVTIIEHFRKKMEVLKEKELPSKGFIERYYTELNMLLRAFLFDLLQINSMEMTSQLLLKTLQEKPYDTLLKEYELYKFIEHSNLGKFANESIELTECYDDYERVLHFMEALYSQEERRKETEKKRGADQ